MYAIVLVMSSPPDFTVSSISLEIASAFSQFSSFSIDFHKAFYHIVKVGN